MKNKKNILIIVIIITLIICGVILLLHFRKPAGSSSSKDINVTHNIEKYGYTLTDNDTNYYQELYHKLRNALDAETIDDELYASLISQIFVTDFYTLSNKISNNDIGGLEFFVENYRDNFALKAKNTIYKSIESNLYGDREQELPTVTKVSIESITKTTYEYGDIVDKDAYNVKLNITYQEDLSYPTSVKLILVHNDDKIEVVKVN